MSILGQKVIAKRHKESLRGAILGETEGSPGRHEREKSLYGRFVPCSFEICQWKEHGQCLLVYILSFRDGGASVRMIDADDMEAERKFASEEDAREFILHMPVLIDLAYLTWFSGG